MKYIKLIVVLLGISVFTIGCGKKTGVEGKVVDGKGQPIVGVKVAAEQLGQKIKNYDHFEITTDSHGAFRYTGLLPNGKYMIVAGSQQWSKWGSPCNIGPEGTIALLDSPITLRYKLSKDNVITDTKTGLMWVIVTTEQMTSLPDQMTLDEAKECIKNLRSGRYSDWRLPTRIELKGLNESSKEHVSFAYPDSDMTINIDSIFNLRVPYVWSSELQGSSGFQNYIFCVGPQNDGFLSDEAFAQVLAVRSNN